MIICGNCENEVDENEIFCSCCSYNLQESLENMQQVKNQHKGEEKKSWFNRISRK